jgi:hypothetical protein
MLTPRARELEPQLVSAARAVNAVATQGLDEQAVVAFMATLATIIDNIEKAGQRIAKKSNQVRTPAER